MTRTAPLTLGTVALALAWAFLGSGRGAGSFSAHMAVHMTVVAIAAPLLALGVASGSWDPLRRVTWSWTAIIASLVELIVVSVWHTPVFHQLARERASVLMLEQTSFLAAGLFLWVSALGGRSARQHGTGVVALLLTAMHMTLLGALLALAPRPLYAGAHHGLASFSALDDQHVGGAIMLAVGGAAYLTGGVWLASKLLQNRASDGCEGTPPGSEPRPREFQGWA